MPVEIKELLIKGMMEGTQEPGKKSPVDPRKVKDEGVGKLSFSLKKQIVDQCVAEVMDKIKKMNDF